MNQTTPDPKDAFFVYQFFVGNFPCRYTNLSYKDVQKYLRDNPKYLASLCPELWLTLYPTLQPPSSSSQKHFALKGDKEIEAILSDPLARRNLLSVYKGSVYGILKVKANDEKRTFSPCEAKDRPKMMANCYDEDWFSKNLSRLLDSLVDMKLFCLLKELAKAVLQDTFKNDAVLQLLCRNSMIALMRLQEKYYSLSSDSRCFQLTAPSPTSAVASSSGSASGDQKKEKDRTQEHLCCCFLAEHAPITPSLASSSSSSSSSRDVSNVQRPGNKRPSGDAAQKKPVFRPEYDNADSFRCLCVPTGSEVDPPLAKKLMCRNSKNPGLVGKSFFKCATNTCDLYVFEFKLHSGDWQRPPFCNCNKAALKIKLDRPGSPNHNKWLYVCPYYLDHDKNCKFSENVEFSKKPSYPQPSFYKRTKRS